MKAIIIAALLSLSFPPYQTELGQVINSETIYTKHDAWKYDTEIAPGSFVVIKFDTKGTAEREDDEILGVWEI